MFYDHCIPTFRLLSKYDVSLMLIISKRFDNSFAIASNSYIVNRCYVLTDKIWNFYSIIKCLKISLLSKS